MKNNIRIFSNYLSGSLIICLLGVFAYANFSFAQTVDPLQMTPADYSLKSFTSVGKSIKAKATYTTLRKMNIAKMTLENPQLKSQLTPDQLTQYQGLADNYTAKKLETYGNYADAVSSKDTQYMDTLNKDTITQQKIIDSAAKDTDWGKYAEASTANELAKDIESGVPGAKETYDSVSDAMLKAAANGDPYAQQVVADEMKKKAQEALDKMMGSKPQTPEEALKELEGKKKCPLATAGQSELLGDMWGEKDVAADKSWDPRPLVGEPGCEEPIINPELCAQDIDGIPAHKRVSKENWQFFKPQNLGVTDEKSYAKLSEGGKQQVAPKGSNQKIAADSSGGRFTAQQVITPDKNGHMQALAHPLRAYTPPGSSMQMLPRDSYVAGQKTKSANGPDNDTDVTDDCKFVPASDSTNPASGPKGNLFNNMFKGFLNPQKPAASGASTGFLKEVQSALNSSIPQAMNGMASFIGERVQQLYENII
jgi:hypothetical protein